MSESRTEVLVGGAVLAVAVGFLIYAGQATGFAPTKSNDYALSASFRSGEGVTIGTDVRLAGVKIGTVRGMSLNQQTYRADTVLTVKDGVLIPDDSTVVISSEGLLGGSFIEIFPGGSLENFAAGDEILDTQGAVSLVSLLMKFVSGSEDE